jgi:hypothetical protein
MPAVMIAKEVWEANERKPDDYGHSDKRRSATKILTSN